ncbi:MAG: GNAT family N-acetyltransferase [Saprospiraceae bacterium]|nr:GNAT family N-acetyltransferase [Saprospiraceae bacterium]
MNIELHRVTADQKSVLNHLLELYCYDFSEYLNTDVDEKGLFNYKYLDQYWQEDGRHAFFIIVDGKIAGFVMVNKDLKIAKEGYCIAEFFLLKKYRNKGIGSKAAYLAFNQFKGSWEVSVITINKPATQFWLKAIDQYTNGKFQSISKMYNKREKLFLTFNA